MLCLLANFLTLCKNRLFILCRLARRSACYYIMPFKRPAPPVHESRSSLSPSSPNLGDDVEGSSKQSTPTTTSKVLYGVKIYVIQAKLSPSQIAELFTLAEKHCRKLCRGVDEADVVLTAISMRKRLERHMTWETAVCVYYLSMALRYLTGCARFSSPRSLLHPNGWLTQLLQGAPFRGRTT